MLFGASVSRPMLDSPEIPMLVRRYCRIITLGGALYWTKVHPEAETFNFADADFLSDYARQNGLLARGHTLVWHESVPPWLPSALAGPNPRGVLEKHISTVVGHLHGKLHSWDVVNEVIAPENGRSDGLRDSVFLRTLGPEFVGTAFRLARAADPQPLLGYNEYGIEPDGAFFERKRTAVLRLLESLRKSEVPIDYFGVQGHLDGTQRYSEAVFGQFLREVEGLGLRVMITELDVDDRALPTDPPKRDRKIADIYDRFLSITLGAVRPEAVITWGLLDRDSWYQHIRPRNDGTPQRSLPFDDDGRPKAAWSVIARRLSLRVS